MVERRRGKAKKQSQQDVQPNIHGKEDTGRQGKNSLRYIAGAFVFWMIGVIFVLYKKSSFPTNGSIISTQILNSKWSQQFSCNPSFQKGIESVGEKSCVPFQCGRAVADAIITEHQAKELLSLATKGLSKGNGSGGATILDLHSGALSYKDQFISFYHKYPDLFQSSDFETYIQVKKTVKAVIADHFKLSSDCLHLTDPTFFSRLDGRPARTLHDEYWHPHVDQVAYPSFHFTSLIYLADLGKDFQGGEFVFIDQKANQTVEPRLGRLVFFTSGEENQHYVEPVRSGARHALTIGFSCNAKLAIPEPGSSAHPAFQKSKRSN